jgi:hypothetical protein
MQSINHMIEKANSTTYVPQTFKQRLEQNLEEELQLKTWLQNATKPQVYTEELQALNTSVPPTTLDYIKYYVLHHKHPHSQENNQMFMQARSALVQLQSRLFQLLNDVERSIDFLNAKLIELNTLIRKEKKINRHLKRQLGMVEGTVNSSEELIDEFTEMYNSAYLQNWGIFVSILAAIFTTNIVYNS